MKLFFLTLLPILLLGASHRTPSIVENDDGSLRLRERAFTIEGDLLDKRKYELFFSMKLNIMKRDQMYPWDTAKFYIGTDGWNPATLIDSLGLNVRGRSIVIPEKSYSDISISGFDCIWLEEVKDTLIIVIRGGDGTASFWARLYCVEGKVTERQIISFNPDGEFDVHRIDKY